MEKKEQKERGGHGRKCTWTWWRPKNRYIVFVYINVLVPITFDNFSHVISINLFFLWLMKLESPDSNLAEYWCTHSHMDRIRQCIKLQIYITYDWSMYQTIWPRKEQIYHKNVYDWSLEDQKTKVLLLYSTYTVVHDYICDIIISPKSLSLIHWPPLTPPSQLVAILVFTFFIVEIFFFSHNPAA